MEILLVLGSSSDDTEEAPDRGGKVLFFKCMFYPLLCVPHSSSSTQSWGSVLPSIVETRDQNSRGCPLLFSNSAPSLFEVCRGGGVIKGHDRKIILRFMLIEE